MKVLNKRRRLENKTNYSKRRKLLEGRKPRIVIRKSNKYILVQYVESVAAQDTIKASAISKELTGFGWSEKMVGSLKSLPAAYLTGYLLGKRINGFKPAIVDLGLLRSTKGSRIYALIKGIKDAGFEVPCGEEVIPAEEKIRNDKTEDFFDEVKSQIDLESKIKNKPKVEAKQSKKE